MLRSSGGRNERTGVKHLFGSPSLGKRRRALDQFEREFGYVWGHGEEQPTMEQQEMRKVWEKVRNNILNNGNNQIRNLETEMEYYTMEWNRYHYDLPVKGEETENV